MALFCVFTRIEAPQFAKLEMFLYDLPVKGTHIGGGIHVTMSDTAPNPCPLLLLGWATRATAWIAKNTNTGAGTDEFAVRVTPDLQDRWAARKSQLTAPQRTFVQNHLDSAVDLSADPAWLSTYRDLNGVNQTMLSESADIVPDP